MTSAVSASGRSLGFINRDFIAAGKTATAFDNYGGEDRFWLGPEGGQFGLYFAPAQPFDFDHWQTPHALQEGTWQARSRTPTSISYEHAFSVTNHAGREFKVNVRREIALLSAEQASLRLGVPLGKALDLGRLRDHEPAHQRRARCVDGANRPAQHLDLGHVRARAGQQRDHPVRGQWHG